MWRAKCMSPNEDRFWTNILGNLGDPPSCAKFWAAYVFPLYDRQVYDAHKKLVFARCVWSLRIIHRWYLGGALDILCQIWQSRVGNIGKCFEENLTVENFASSFSVHRKKFPWHFHAFQGFCHDKYLYCDAARTNSTEVEFNAVVISNWTWSWSMGILGYVECEQYICWVWKRWYCTEGIGVFYAGSVTCMCAFDSNCPRHHE